MNWERVDLSSEEFGGPSEPPAVCGLLYRGRRHAISGPPEAAKTLAALILGLEWVSTVRGCSRCSTLRWASGRRGCSSQELGATLDEMRVSFTSRPLTRRTQQTSMRWHQLG